MQYNPIETRSIVLATSSYFDIYMYAPVITPNYALGWQHGAYISHPSLPASYPILFSCFHSTLSTLIKKLHVALAKNFLHLNAYSCAAMLTICYNCNIMLSHDKSLHQRAIVTAVHILSYWLPQHTDYT